MKNRSLASLILLAILAPSCGSGGGGGGGGGRSVIVPRWTETYRKPTSVDLRAVRFGGPNSGIAAGKFGTFVRTDDGGNTWYQLEHTPDSTTGDVRSMAAGGTTTFAVGSIPAGGAPTGCIAWQSTDAVTFVQPESLPTAFAEPWVDVGLIFPAGNNIPPATLRLRPSGLLDAYQGTLLVTRDSKHNPQNPTPPPVPDTPWTSANGLYVFGNSGLWYVCGDNGGTAQIRRSTNSGADFTTMNVPAATPPLNRITFPGATNGFACGNDNTILSTVNGVDWTALPNKPGALPAGHLRALVFLNDFLGFAVGDGGRIYRLRFTSIWNWEVQTSGTTEDLYDVAFGDNNTVYAVGNNGTVVKCANASAAAGVTWTVKSGPAANPTAVFNAVDFRPDGVIGLAVGNGGALYRTLDGGSTWTSFNTGATGNLTAVSIPRTGTGTVAFVGNDAGTVFVNTALQASGTWTAGTGTSPGAIKAILFPKDDANGIATGAAGSFARLSYVNPGGLTVTPQTLVPAQAGTNYAAAADPTGNKVYLAGDNGYLVESLNNGLTWAAVSPAPPAVSLRALQVPTGPSFTMFAAASTGDIHRLSAAITPAWSTTAGAAIGTPVGLAFSNDATGMVVTQGAGTGGVYYTTNSGALWTKSVLHVPVDTGTHVLNGVWMIGSTGYVVGGNGLIMRTTTVGK